MSDSFTLHTELLRRAQGGDAAAFAALIERVAARLLGFLRRGAGRAIAGDADEDDLLQVVLTQAWRLLPRLDDRGPEAFYRWLVAIARHAIGDRRKYLDAKGRAELRASGADSVWSRLTDSQASATRLAMLREAARRLEQELLGLDEKLRIVVTLHLLEGKTLSEVGQELGITKNAVWERLRHGLAALRERIGSPAP